MSIDDMVGRDTRIDRLAKLCGWSRRETRACLEDVWAICYDRVVPYLPGDDIEVTAARDAISPPAHPEGFVAALMVVGLARPAMASDRFFTKPKDGTQIPWRDQKWRGAIYLCGASERIGFLLSSSVHGAEGGKKSGETRRKKSKRPLSDPSPTLEGSTNPSAPDNPPDTSPDRSPDRPHAPAPSKLPDQDPEHRARLDLAAEIWGRLEVARSRVAKELGVDLRPLPAFDQGRTALAMRIREAPDLDRARKDCEHVLAYREAEAIAKRETKWLSGGMFQENSWRVAVSASLSEARRPPRSSNGIESPSVRVKAADDDMPPLGFGGKS